MPNIQTSRDTCTVIVTVDAAADLIPVLEAHARVGIERFPEYDGFIGGALHRSEDGTRIIQYLQWTSEAAYRACIDDPAWDKLPSAREFMDAVSTGQARMDARQYTVEATS